MQKSYHLIYNKLVHLQKDMFLLPYTFLYNIVTKRLNEAKEKKEIKSFKETVANIFKKKEEKKS